jgi:hypothetical protein
MGFLFSHRMVQLILVTILAILIAICVTASPLMLVNAPVVTEKTSGP